MTMLTMTRVLQTADGGCPARRHLLPPEIEIISAENQIDNAKIVIQIDPHLQIVDENVITRTLEIMEQQRLDVLVLCHASRHCIYDEANAKIAKNESDRTQIIERIARARDEGHPENWGLFEIAFLAWRTNDLAKQMLRHLTEAGGTILDLPIVLRDLRHSTLRWAATSEISLTDRSQFRLHNHLSDRVQDPEHATIILPALGRGAQTLDLIDSLRESAGMPFELICVVDGDPELTDRLAEDGACRVISHDKRCGYWHALTTATASSTGKYLGNLANDVLPGHLWLKRAVDLFKHRFEANGKTKTGPRLRSAHRDDHEEIFWGDGDGVVGWNDGLHEETHSCHFLISRSYLQAFGGWPVWYDHNYGDTEICARARADKRYCKAPWALLYHRHWAQGGRKLMDSIYVEGMRKSSIDQKLFEMRRNAAWPDPKREPAKFNMCVNMSRIP
jgi:hypothetical protein